MESSKAALAAGNINPSMIDSVFVGNVAQTSIDAAYIARHVQLKTGISQEKQALTITRLCGSGFQTVIHGVQDILLGQSKVSLCGGSGTLRFGHLVLFYR